jgi:kynurenine formamidase
MLSRYFNRIICVFPPLTNGQGYGINTASLDAVATWQGLPTNWSKPGDILLIRTGYMKAYRNLTAYEQETMPWNPELGSVGMNASDDSLAWLWEKKLALVGADNPAFESLPMDKSIGGVPRSLHQVFIGGESHIVPEVGGDADGGVRLGTEYC